MDYQTIQLDVDQRGVATLTLNRPEVRNAFNAEMIQELTDAIADCAQNKATRVLVLRGNGAHFSAGADLNWMRSMAGMDFSENRADAEKLADLMHGLNTFPGPTIARVTGAAYGGALGLIACCDMAFASEEATFCLSEVKLGLVPAVISPYVIQAIGERAARRFFLTAEVMNSELAEKLGLISTRCASDQLDNTIFRTVDSLLQNGPVALQEAKQLVRHVAGQSLDSNLRQHTTDLIARIRVSTEGQEGLTAFLEKRKPDWSK